jgi:hypothetical protein
MALRWAISALFAALLTGCGGPHRPPPRSSRYAGLPISGSLAFARRLGFTDCVDDGTDMRCRRSSVMIGGHGPFEAAVDLVDGGFDELILWHDRNQYAVYAIADALERQGWRQCYADANGHGDQDIYSKPGVPVIFSMDLSYWGKRRMRIIPTWNHHERRC